MLRLFRRGHVETKAPLSLVPPAPVEAPAAPPPAPTGPDIGLLQRQANVSAAASEAGVSIGWITHDAAQVADQARLIAAASEEVAASTSEIAARSATSAATAERARAGIAECAVDMRQAAERMGIIETCTGEIGGRLDGFATAARRIEEMASAIAAISAQTNLLALNATIEAARAGEAGRGFAVVAGEVKALSAQTAKATEEIRARLASLQGELASMQGAVDQSRAAVSAGSAVMARANARVEAESASVAAAASEMRAMAEIMDQQIQATSEISSNITRIASGTEKSRGEIADAIGSLLKVEQASLDLLSGDDALAVRLARLPADCAAWRRRLAAALVGLAAADEQATTCPGQHATLPASVQVHLDGARARAAEMVASVRASDWGSAADTFRAFEAKLQDAAKAAESAAARGLAS
ncbi:methyl-accepting chemotaxis protein [Methylobacterium durans]|uniref:methyl-accepting chemotaxis protein n=1 Tax=Methylobacterium durans TaxID=2202825 RepID=UPI002AFFD45B|nr:methyl-accepting chemotaxis protein [Methylobacterium durans]MEA1833644.1 methyl-accepting chemotaxis protein [Methylobacterium durans]